MNVKNTYAFQSPIGTLELCETQGAITRLSLLEPWKNSGNIQMQRFTVHSDLLYEAHKQLEEYFEGNRKIFDVPICFRGTEFQQKVWKGLQEIPYGETWSYQDIALHIENPKAVRAVGQANHRNPIMIIVPCHRVVNKDGSLGGFGCGVDVKQYLLELERRYR